MLIVFLYYDILCCVVLYGVELCCARLSYVMLCTLCLAVLCCGWFGRLKDFNLTNEGIGLGVI